MEDMTSPVRVNFTYFVQRTLKTIQNLKTIMPCWCHSCVKMTSHCLFSISERSASVKVNLSLFVGTRWKWVVRFTLRQLCPRWKGPPSAPRVGGCVSPGSDLILWQREIPHPCHSKWSHSLYRLGYRGSVRYRMNYTDKRWKDIWTQCVKSD